MDYVRWIFNLDFCIPRYLIMKKLLMNKLRIAWQIRVKRFEHKIKSGGVGNLTNASWEEKKKNDWGDAYG